MLDLYASSDLLLALNTATTFGLYSHPVKLYEAMSMGVPVLATETPATRFVLADRPWSLLRESTPETLAQRITEALDRNECPAPLEPGWSRQVAKLEAVLRR